ncbi:MAG: hypothetical protein RMK78_04160 [Thermaurantiacus sp.]|uniref:hypothetical protein n=1 Tax=Thermaurantiacus sp. TaxID=2820283 RepID=UPI00298F00BE|nr:hypothetical protein [Thermaurantiacus sp.]MDW8414649.1 hypothetical protein [Thermaurantiacus sp.]
MAGRPNIKEELLKGVEIGGRHYKAHLDGFNQLDHITGKAPSPRISFFYFTDDAELCALRYDNWKLVFMEQRVTGQLGIWFEPFVPLRAPKLYNLRTDPYEQADITSNTYWDWYIDHLFLMTPSQDIVGQFLMTFQEFPPAQKAAAFNLDRVMEKLSYGASGGA